MNLIRLEQVGFGVDFVFPYHKKKNKNKEVIAFNPGSCQGRPWKLPGLALEAARAGPGRSQGQPWKLLGLALGFPTCSGSRQVKRTFLVGSADLPVLEVSDWRIYRNFAT